MDEINLFYEEKMNTTNPTCLVCDSSEAEIPLLILRYKGGEIFICPTHLPILIHHPEQIADKLQRFSPSA